MLGRGLFRVASLQDHEAGIGICDCGSFFLVTQKKGNSDLVDSCPLGSLGSCRGQRPASMPSWALTASPPQVCPGPGTSHSPHTAGLILPTGCCCPSGGHVPAAALSHMHNVWICSFLLVFPHFYHFPKWQCLTGNCIMNVTTRSATGTGK